MGRHANHEASLEALAHINSKKVYEGMFISLRHDEITYPDGQKGSWDIVLHPGAVAIVPVTSGGKIILIEQFRRAIGKVILEIPAGLLDPGEEPAACAQRELQEEVGYKAGKLSLVGTYFSSPGAYTEKVYLYKAEDLQVSRLEAEDTHKVDIRIVPIAEALALVENGTICDFKTALAILSVGRSL